MKKYTKKQTLTIEITVGFLFFILAFSLPDNILEYTWAKTFVDGVGSVIPFVNNLVNNPDFPTSAFYYSTLLFPAVFFGVFYFFVEEEALFNKERVLKKMRGKSDVVIYLGIIFLISLLLLALVGIAYFSFIGEYGISGNSRQDFFFLGKFGSATFGMYFFVFCFYHSFWHMYYLFKYTRAGLFRE